ncbi:hypothetical protein [Pseudodonghicola sp.]|uniref:hypothetical protein n=1 Tax=Pseudodonghicola sp. TaxID=1969463 RepID=UPI003A97DBC0
MALILFLHGASSSGTWTPAAYPDWRAARPGFFSGFHRALARRQAPLPRSTFFAAPKAP